MRHRAKAMVGLVFVLGCASNTNSNTANFDSTEIENKDTGSVTTADSGENTDESDTSEDTESEKYHPCSCNQPTAPYCSDFPNPNEPDGCRRILLDKLPNGQAFYYGASDPQLSRDGNFAVFVQTTSEDLECQEESRLEIDTNKVADVYLVNLQTFEMELLSVSNDGTPGDQSSDTPSISKDGRFVAFTSRAKNLTKPSPKSHGIYLRDREKGTTELVSVSSSGALPNNSCSHPIISADGRFVLFESFATNLVPGDSNGEGDLFLRDRQLKLTERVSVGEDGTEADDHIIEGLGISKDGRFVLFRHPSNLSPLDDDTEETGYAPKRSDIYLRDRTTGRNWMPGLSKDGEHTRTGALMLSDDGKTILLPASPTRFGIDVPENRRTGNVIATLGNNGFNYKALPPPMDVENGLSRIVAVDESMTAVAMESCYSFENISCDEHGDRCVGNACALNMERKEVSLITASESGRPGINTNYDWASSSEAMMTDYVELSNYSEDGKRILFSTMLYGIVENKAICCHNTLRHVYLWDCR